MTATRWVSLVFCTALVACNALPRDPEGTLERVKTERRFSVGFIGQVGEEPAAGKLVAEIGKRTGARMLPRQGDSEALLQALVEGRADLVVGQFIKDSPWQTDVAFGPVLSRSGPNGEEIELKAAVRNGENRWLMLVESASRAVSTEARGQ